MIARGSWHLLLCASVVGISSSCHAFARLTPGQNSNSHSSSSSSSSSTATTEYVPRWRSQLQAATSTSTSSSTSSSERATDEKDNLTTSEVMSLDSIRSSLIRQEETIIFALIERAQHRRNPMVYEQAGKLGLVGTPPGSKPASSSSAAEEDNNSSSSSSSNSNSNNMSFLEWMLTGTEALHSAVRRYTSPEEHAFFPERLPTTKVLDQELEFPPDLLSSLGGASDVNFNEILLRKYIDVIVPAIAVMGDDEQHGSSVLADIAVLQALSRRVHYGKFVAESKYLADPESYQRLVDTGDANGVMELLTNATVEATVLRRARLKAATYGTEPLLAYLPPLESSNADETSIVAAAAASAVVAAIEAMGDKNKNKMWKNKVCPATVESVYRDIIIPLTKDVEVAYLFKRCGKEPPPEYAPDRMSCDVTQLGTNGST